jgi:hypothetical protein
MERPYSVPSTFSRFAILIASAFLVSPALNLSIHAQVAAEQEIVVQAEEVEVPSAYGAPAAFSQSRFAPLTNAYVLPPGEIYNAVIYELDDVHYRLPDNHWTFEGEMGLPYRFNIAVESDLQHYDGDTQISTVSF